MSDSPKMPDTDADALPVDPNLLPKMLAAQKDDYLRLSADFDNFRKRTRRDSAEQAAAEKEAFIRDLLPILDNLNRALACEGATSSAQLHQGVEMTMKQVGALLHRHGIETVEALGEPFDPHRHEAIAVGHDARRPDRVVLEVVQRGYYRGDKLIRPAQVIVNDPARSPGVARGH